MVVQRHVHDEFRGWLRDKIDSTCLTCGTWMWCESTQRLTDIGNGNNLFPQHQFEIWILDYSPAVHGIMSSEDASEIHQNALWHQGQNPDDAITPREANQ